MLFNQAVKRNIERFPNKFKFQLTESSTKGWGTHRKYLPYVFTEQGVSILSAVLRSKIAIEVSIKVIESFVQMRRFISSNSNVFGRFERTEQRLSLHDENFNKIFNALEYKTKNQHKVYFTMVKYMMLIDNYIDDTIFTLCSKYPNVRFTIYIKAIKVGFPKV